MFHADSRFAGLHGARLAVSGVTLLCFLSYHNQTLGQATATPCPATPTPIGETCPTSTICPFPTATATPLPRPADIPTPIATPTPEYYRGTKFLESQYASFGNRWTQRPLLDKANTFQFIWGIPMAYNTRVSNGNATPSIYSPLVSQAVYWDNLWDANKKTDFADRTQHFLGSYASCAISFMSGADETRDSDTGGSEFDHKYAIGEEHIAMALRGGAGNGAVPEQLDQWNVIGSTSFGMASLVDHNVIESGGGQARRKVHVNQLSGSESAAWLGRVMGPKLSNTASPGPVDLRDAYLHEDSAFNLVPAEVFSMFGTSNLVFLDNKRGDYCSINAPDNPKEGGYINYVVGTRSIVGAFTKNSWVNANKCLAFEGGLSIGDGWASAPGWFCGDADDERSGSVIRDFTGIGIWQPLINPCDPFFNNPNALRAARAFAFYDFTPTSGGGSAPLVAGNVDEVFRDRVVEPEKYGGFVRGSMIVGDSQTGSTKDSGYNTDVLHVRDVIHLTPRLSPPTFNEKLPPSERVGLMYFDLTKNCIRVSVAAHNTAFTGEDAWKKAEIVWVDLELNKTHIDPVLDVMGAEDSADSLAYKSKQQTRDAMDLAAQNAKDEISPYIHPSMELAGPIISETDTVSFTLLHSGFGGELSNLYWRVQAMGPKQERRETNWKKFGGAEISPVSGLEDGAVIVLFSPGTLDAEGNSIPVECSGNMLQLFAINGATGQSTGLSIQL